MAQTPLKTATNCLKTCIWAKIAPKARFFYWSRGLKPSSERRAQTPRVQPALVFLRIKSGASSKSGHIAFGAISAHIHVFRRLVAVLRGVLAMFH